MSVHSQGEGKEPAQMGFPETRGAFFKSNVYTVILVETI